LLCQQLSLVLPVSANFPYRLKTVSLIFSVFISGDYYLAIYFLLQKRDALFLSQTKKRFLIKFLHFFPDDRRIYCPALTKATWDG